MIPNENDDISSRKNRRKIRSKSQPATNLIKAIQTALAPIVNNNKNALSLNVDIESLKITFEQVEDIQNDLNEELTAKIPVSASSATKIYVCNNNNIKYKKQIDSDYIVIKETQKAKMKIDDLTEMKIDLKVHSHLAQQNLSVIQLYGWYEDDEMFCILYQYCKNGDLLEELNKLRNPFNYKWFNKARKEIKKISETLCYMHQKGWAHKDLTLENILVDKNRNFYLHDFGLVEEFQNNENDDQSSFSLFSSYNNGNNGYDDDIQSEQIAIKRTRSSIWSGKIEHMSPENYDTFMGNMELFDAFSNDIWGLGIITMCCFSTQTFLWTAPDKKMNSYRNIICNLDKELYKAFKIDQQKDVQMKIALISLIDLLRKVFVDEEHRINIDQFSNHAFFQNIPSELEENDKQKETCCESCLIL